MKFVHLKNAIIGLVVLFSLLLIVAAIQFTFSDVVSAFIKQSMMLVLLLTLILAGHFWTTSHENSTGAQKLMINLLYGEIACSALISIVMIYGNFGFYKMLVLLLAFQGAHGAVYLCYMFLYDEKPVQQGSLTDQEIIAKSNKKPLDSSAQE